LIANLFHSWRGFHSTAIAVSLLFFCSSASAQTKAAAAPVSHIVAPPAGYHFLEGTNYTYSVEWHFITAGIATIHVESAGTEKHVLASADSAGVVNMLYTVRDQFQSSLDPKTFCSLGISKHSEEGSHKRQTEIRFDYTRRKSVLDETNLKTKEAKKVENDVPTCVTDVLAGFYYVASLPLAQGDVYTFPVNDGGKTADVRAEVGGQEQVKTPTGTYPTIRVRLEAITGPLKSKGSLWIWYTADEHHIPVQMQAKLSWGTLLFRLQKIEKR
jgi:Protein of unknown function (DUF3108)